MDQCNVSSNLWQVVDEQTQSIKIQISGVDVMYKQLKYSVILCLVLAGNFVQTTFAADRIRSTQGALATTVHQTSYYDEVSVLRADNKRLKGLISNLNMRISNFENSKRFCSDVHTSATKAGVSQDCYQFNCDQATGACLLKPLDSYDCVQGHNLLWDNGKCVDATTHVDADTHK